MITADTITDEQIRELMLSADSATSGHAMSALHGRSEWIRYRGRARCAEIINARRPK